MHIAIGYSWSPTTTGHHIEAALNLTGHTVTYVGLPSRERPGYDSMVPVNHIIEGLQEKPDLFLWVDPGGRYFPLGIEDLTIPTACYLIDVHLGVWRRQVARFFDAVFVAQKDYLDLYKGSVGHQQIYWLPLAAAPDVHKDHGLPRIYDVGFVGKISRAHRNTPRVRRLKLIGHRFQTNDLFRYYSAEETGRVYSQSSIVLNTSIAGDVNMRVFEATACGAMLLTDSVANGLSELFQVGKEIVVYSDDRDLIDKISHYLLHDSERIAIAYAGQARTMAGHCYTHRVQQILDAISLPSFRQLAPMRKIAFKERYKARHEILVHLHMVDAILDAAREKGAGPAERATSVLPALLRRLIR